MGWKRIPAQTKVSSQKADIGEFDIGQFFCSGTSSRAASMGNVDNHVYPVWDPYRRSLLDGCPNHSRFKTNRARSRTSAFGNGQRALRSCRVGHHSKKLPFSTSNLNCSRTTIPPESAISRAVRTRGFGASTSQRSALKLASHLTSDHRPYSSS